MPSIGDLVRITSCSNIYSQLACNVFYYVVAAWTGAVDIETVLDKWSEEVTLPLAPRLSTSLTPGTVKWENVDNPAETASVVGGFAGTDTGDTMPSFVAYSVRLFGETAITRSGWKRIPGVPEAFISDGEVVAATMTAFDAWVAASLVAPVSSEVPGDFLLEPVIVGRNPDGSLNLTAINPIASGKTQPRVSTQNTRKVGRGV